ncbi:hypothetical protein [Vitiosangium sp. GDMCC 1.1324]|uniref:hypothetical protein n=1 Tax=Vitiosangium sp. (strain GDMCC 1.1324) TaxID=2138576 RepID=UPI000D357337|nr:hypothetical protein [Vitiosangium sp. GDMCC 1.1324]PTL75741.1 hypothetical protein DAT35_52755 [Vitiosangium sp. GDMCC 1.1324]
MLRKKLIALSTIAVAGLVMGLSEEAFAQEAYRRQSATGCLPITASSLNVKNDSGAIGNGGSSTTMRLVCAVNDDSYLSKDLVRSILVDVYDGSTREAVDARACVTYMGSTGGACGPGAATSESGVGMEVLIPSPSVWEDNPYEYGFIVVTLPVLEAGRLPSSMHGYILMD